MRIAADTAEMCLRSERTLSFEARYASASAVPC